MNTMAATNTLDMKVKLSTLWIFVMFNYLYCDVVGIMDPVLLNQFLTGSIGEIKLTQNFLLGASIMMEVPIAMVLLSRILEYKANRWANIFAGSFKTIVMISSMFVGDGPTNYYIFFGSIEIATTILIVWYAWNWSNPESNP